MRIRTRYYVVRTDRVKEIWLACNPKHVENYTIPLYAAPQEQGLPSGMKMMMDRAPTREEAMRKINEPPQVTGSPEHIKDSSSGPASGSPDTLLERLDSKRKEFADHHLNMMPINVLEYDELREHLRALEAESWAHAEHAKVYRKEAEERAIRLDALQSELDKVRKDLAEALTGWRINLNVCDLLKSREPSTISDEYRRLHSIRDSAIEQESTGKGG